jgi:radical SAM superfamily enzyme YgiQ (UPF0313 family)
MSRILLIFPKLEPDKDFHYAPISALSVASKLLANGYSVEILDQRIEENFYTLLAEILPKFDEVMISAFTGNQISEAYKIAMFIKINSSKKITLGGPHATAMSQQCLDDPLIDAVWEGYAERGEYLMPWHLIDIEKYINPMTERFIYISSYSCPGQCTFCATKERRQLVFLPQEKVEKDIDNLMALYPFKEMVLFDATVFTKPERVRFIAELAKKHNLKWICDSRADEICRTPKDIIEFAVKSGLKQITIGLESGSQQVVSKMKKGKNHLENYKKCAEIMSHYDVKMCSGVIFGTPGETPEDIKQTIKYIKEIKAINPNFYISTTFFMPLPDTEMCDMAKEYGYQEPKTLREWAKHGAESHYSYNKFHASMWINQPKEYRKIYDSFVAKNNNIFI